MNRIIKRVAVLGSGVMGSRIACHFAGVGVEVWLLDMVLPGTDQKAPKSQRNKLVNDALAAAVKSNPSPIYTSSVLDRITTGNFEDDMQQIANADWIVEVVVERLDIKKLIYGQIEQYRKPSTLVTTNTSGIPIHQLIEGRTEDFKAHFCGAHFFNPPRYLRLLEVIPSDFTSPSVVDFVMKYGANNLGKTTVLCKDTPAFIANRVGIFSLMNCFHLMDQMGLTIDEVDALTGPAIGRPKSATFRTADVVGIDTLVKVANGVADNCLQDEARAQFVSPSWLNTIMENKWLGDKTGQGFFKKTVSPTSGEKEIWLLNLHTMVYEPRKKVHFPTLDALKSIESITQKTQIAYAGKDKAGDFYRAFHHSLFAYVANRIPEISDELYRLDDAMKAGFGWEIGAFEAWDCLGVAQVGAAMKALEIPVAAWVDQMLALGFNRFYKVEGGKKWYYDAKLNNYQPIPGSDTFLVLKNYDAQRLWKNSACNLYHIGDDVLGLEWNTKMNTIGGEVLEGIQYGIGEAEKQYKGLVIGNDGANFSAGANVGLIFMYAAEQEYDELNMVINLFQQTMMRVRYSGVPVVIAPHGLSLGGGCEINLHADKVIAAAETYIGLVELGVGLIPGGGGTKEFALRASDELHEDEPELNTLKKRFFTIATAKVATSAYDAYDLGILRKGFDEVSINPNRRLHLAKNSVIQLFDKGYTIPIQRKDIKVLGRMGLGALLAGINSMVTGGYATAHDALIAKKLAYVMCGGDLSEPTKVSEQYLLDLEREAFLSLCGEKKTLERIQSVLKGGKPIRN